MRDRGGRCTADHVINFLLDELVVNGIAIDETVRDAARVLERFYAQTRYPDALGGIAPNRSQRPPYAQYARAKGGMPAR